MTDPMKFADLMTRIALWHASLEQPIPDCFDCRTLSNAMGTTMKHLHTPLAVLGWHRAEVWHRMEDKRVRRVYYAPPGHTVPRPPRGRPHFNLDDYVAIHFQKEQQQ